MSLSFFSFLDYVCGWSAFTMVRKTMDLHVLPNLASMVDSTSFDLWMLKGSVDTFGVVINFLNESWNPMHVTMGLHEMNETSGQNMVIQLQSLLSKLGLMHYVITFWKTKHQFDNHGIHIVFHRWLWTSDKPLKLMKVHVLVIWCLMMFKACQYVTNDEKDYKDLTHG